MEYWSGRVNSDNFRGGQVLKGRLAEEVIQKNESEYFNAVNLGDT